ncbi:MAG: PhnD/SsuA/transferrin family substrate-binding protein, partial [Alkalispirochaeta sp.]
DRCVLATSSELISAEEGREVDRVALTHPLSTCGYLSTVHLLHWRSISINANDYSYLGSHEAVALAVAQREAFMGGLKDAIAERYTGLGVQIIDRTERLPGFALVANGATVSAGEISAIRTALLRRDGAELSELDVGRYGFASIDEEAYRRVVDMIDESGISVSVEGIVP